MKKEKRKKPKYQISNKDFCPGCNREWDLCICDELYPEESLIERDDQNIESGYNIY